MRGTRRTRAAERGGCAEDGRCRIALAGPAPLLPHQSRGHPGAPTLDLFRPAPARRARAAAGARARRASPLRLAPERCRRGTPASSPASGAASDTLDRSSQARQAAQSPPFARPPATMAPRVKRIMTQPIVRGAGRAAHLRAAFAPSERRRSHTVVASSATTPSPRVAREPTLARAADGWPSADPPALLPPPPSSLRPPGRDRRSPPGRPSPLLRPPAFPEPHRLPPLRSAEPDLQVSAE